jgi:cystathionine beta-lyase/cystathionine gamma-synthase
MDSAMKKIETALIHEGKSFNTTASVVPPIFQTSTYYASADPEEYLQAATTPAHPTFYHRHGNPVSAQAAALLARLEGKDAALLTSTGMAAISTAVLSVVKAGDHVIAQQAHYSAAKILFTEVLPDFGVEVTFVDQADPSAFADAVLPHTRLIYVETPSNPNLLLTDLQAIAQLAQDKNLVTICDNTFASPLNQRPGDLGIDIVVHSATKYLGGHSDLTAGVICGSQQAVDATWKKLLTFGAALAPFDAWLLLRGLRTLSLRVRQINENAQALAEWLEAHPAVSRVRYCGLPSHPQYALACQQMSGFTGMMAIELIAENEQQAFLRAQTFLNSLQVFANAASLGGVESLAVHPASMWGKHHDPVEKQKAGVTDGLIRISVGIEHISDLIADMEQALAKAAKV